MVAKQNFNFVSVIGTTFFNKNNVPTLLNPYWDKNSKFIFIRPEYESHYLRDNILKEFITSVDSTTRLRNIVNQEILKTIFILGNIHILFIRK